MVLRLINKKYFQWLHGLHKSRMVGLHFRQTTAEDYDDVVSIRKHLYDGLDYLPSEYHEMLKHNTGIAGFIGKTMISFMFAAVIDDGKSILMQSVRVREEFVGRGIISEQKKYCFNNFCGGAERSVICTTCPSALTVLQKKGAFVVFQRNAVIFKTTNHTLRDMALSADVRLSPLETVDAKLLEKIFLYRHENHLLFPENRIVVNCVPYRLLVSNINRIFNSYAKLVASFTKDEDDKCFNVPVLISATTSMPCEAGKVIYMDFYGEIDDKELVAAHISKQMSSHQTTGDRRLVLYITYDKEQHIDNIQRLLSIHSWELTDSEINYGIEEKFKD